MPRRQPATFSRSREPSLSFPSFRTFSRTRQVSLSFAVFSPLFLRTSLIVTTVLSSSLRSRCIFETFPRARASGARPPNPPALPLGPLSRSRLRACVRAKKNGAGAWKRDTRITGCPAMLAEDIRRASRPLAIYALAEIEEKRDAQLS